MSTRESVTLLHLSDIQFGRNHRFGRLQAETDEPFDTLLVRLTDDLKLLREQFALQPEVVVLSGDLAEWGRRKEFEDVLQFVVGLCDFLALGRGRVVFVPGNHDVNRGACEAYFCQCKGDDEKPQPPYWPKWRHFGHLFSTFYEGCPDVAFTEAAPWSLYEMPDIPLVVAGINSTMLESHQAADHCGWVGVKQLRWFEEHLVSYRERDWLRIGVLHHNLERGAVDDEENLRDRDDFEKHLSGSLNLVLHGHTHKGKLGWLSQTVPIVSTGSAALKVEARPDEIPNQYQVVRIQRDGLDRWGRLYDPSRKQWIGDTRISSQGNHWHDRQQVGFVSVAGTLGATPNAQVTSDTMTHPLGGTRAPAAGGSHPSPFTTAPQSLGAASSPGAIPREGVGAATQERCVAIGGNAHSAIINTGNNVHIAVGQANAPPDPAAARAAEETYLRNLAASCNELPLATLGGEPDLRILLDEVYVALDTLTLAPGDADADAPGGKGSREPGTIPRVEQRRLSCLEVAAQCERLVLLGQPGGGKTTLVRRLAGLLARARLTGHDLLPGWQTSPLPVVVTVPDFVAHLPGPATLERLSGPRRSQELKSAVCRVLQGCAAHASADAFGDGLVQALESGDVLLVLDGLDEVAETTRPLVREAVGIVPVACPGVRRVIVTCRVRSYGEESALAGYEAHQVAPLDDGQIGCFIEAWYEARARRKMLPRQRLRERTDDLLRAALSEPLRTMAGNPMLLTTMAILHQREVGLPRQRVRLYREAVLILVQRWQKEKGVEVDPELAAFLEDDHRVCDVLERVAGLAHQREAGARQEEGEGLARGVLVVELERPANLGTLRLAGLFLDYVDHRAGLLAGHGGENGRPDTYGFPHRTFQEYLAGCNLLRGRGVAREYRERLDAVDLWRMAAHLGIEELIYNRRCPKDALDLAYDLCPPYPPTTTAAWRGVLWSAHAALHLGRDCVIEDKKEQGATDYWNRVRQRLLAIVEGPHLAAAERVEAGRLLARLGDPRESVLDPLRMEWRDIPAGPFWMGSDEEKDEYYRLEERPAGEFDLAYPYRISRDPVTNAQYEAFVAAGGYREARFWGEARAAGVWKDGEVTTRIWNPRTERLESVTTEGPARQGEPFDLPNQPVVELCWYEALAWCRWLTEWMHAEGRLPKHQAVSIPSEPEWEKAARGVADQRRYPWGDEPDPDQANYRETHLGGPSPVGCFPGGVSPHDVVDMAGNVWEWTRSHEGDYPYPADANGCVDRERLDAGRDVMRVVRGGAFSCDPRHVRCAYRGRNLPDNHYLDLGFRVVVSPSSP